MWHPTGVSGVGPHSVNLGAGKWTSGECQGCFSGVHSSGAEGGGEPEAVAAAESSLISRWVPLIFFFFLRNSSYSSPPGPIKHLAAHSAAWPSPRTPEAAPAPGLAPLQPLYHAVPVPGDLILLEHSSYHQIFQCPLSLVSNLRICWNTVGCSLCSSDQLGISLALRGSGFRSHLCCRHLVSLEKFS